MVLYSNIDGIVSKKLELEDYIGKEEPMVVCLCETKLNKEISSEVFRWKNYNVWRRDRKNKGGGGVMILTHEKLKTKKIDGEENEAEILAVEVNSQGNKLDVVVAYMPPHTRTWSAEEYNGLKDTMTQGLERIINRAGNNELLIVGDFNCKEVNWEEGEAGGGESSWGCKLLELTNDNLLVQNVKECTRKRGQDEESRLDLAFTKDKDTIENIKYLPPFGCSDHVKIEMEINLGYPTEKERGEHREEWYNYPKADYNILRHEFKHTDWNRMHEENTPEGKCRVFKQKYDELIERHVPKRKEETYKKQPWFNKRCRKAKEKRDRAWGITRKRKNNQTWEKYTKLRNEYTKIRRQEAKNYEKNIVNKCESDPRLFYRHINSKIKTKEKIKRLKRGDTVFEDDESLCEVMNDTLHTVFVPEEEYNGPEAVPVGDGNGWVDQVELDANELLELMKGLDVGKAMGPDGVSGWVLKECAEELLKPIYEIVKCSLDSGKVPTDWKRANIVPIYKGGNKEEPLNYRPVSLTSILCKMCERVIKRRWIKVLEENRLLSPTQFGFREGSSTVTNLISFYDRVTEILQERDGWVDCVYLDIKKAFDRVPHERLMWKLENYGGVKGKTLEWMRDYLQGRQMRTMIRNKFSTWKRVTSGVPQGAVLAPIMFLVYINDMGEGINSYMNMFADDAKMMRHIKSEQNCRELQRDLDKIKQWSEKWKLDFNTKKCHVIEMGTSKNRPHWQYKLGDDIIEKSKKEKDLGIIINEDLSPESHINKIVGETYGLLNRIKIAFNYLDAEMLAKIIKVMIRPRLEYAATVWSPHHKKHINKLEKVQRAATRMIPELRGLNYEERLISLKLTTLEKRRERGDMIMMYKCTREIEKIDRENFIIRDEGRTRGHSYKVKKGRCMGDVRKYGFPYRSIDKWNSLGEEVVCARSIHKFKENVDKFELGSGTIRV